MDRNELPFRKNCEGYLIYKDGKVIVRDTEKGYLEFPGGGVDENETPEEALKREAFEEAGVILKEKLKKINVLKFLWDSDWAKTEKQKQRYKKFKGEEMHFFIGKVKEFVAPQGDSKETGWLGKRTMTIKEAINKINQSRPFAKDIEEYREFQISALKMIDSNKKA